jgi:hypothetical protein
MSVKKVEQVTLPEVAVKAMVYVPGGVPPTG